MPGADEASVSMRAALFDARTLGADPTINAAMEGAWFTRDPGPDQPGAWMDRTGIPVDLMVPEALAGSAGRRSARIPPHGRRAMRRGVGLEAAVIDNDRIGIRALDRKDDRVRLARVAGPAALLVAKLHKLGERQAAASRLVDNDAHDLYRLLVAIPTARLASRLSALRTDPLAGLVTVQALRYLEALFAEGPNALGSMMAGRAEEGVGDPEQVAISVASLASDDLVSSVSR